MKKPYASITTLNCHSTSTCPELSAAQKQQHQRPGSRETRANNSLRLLVLHLTTLNGPSRQSPCTTFAAALENLVSVPWPRSCLSDGSIQATTRLDNHVCALAPRTHVRQCALRFVFLSDIPFPQLVFTIFRQSFHLMVWATMNHRGHQTNLEEKVTENVDKWQRSVFSLLTSAIKQQTWSASPLHCLHCCPERDAQGLLPVTCHGQ